MKNPITELLESVAESGTESTAAERAVLASRGGYAEREVVKEGVKSADRQIRLLLKGKLAAPNGDVPAEVQRIIAETSEKFARYVVDDPAGISAASAKVVDDIVAAGRSGGTATNQEKRAAAQDARQRMRPVRDLLRQIAAGASLTDADIEALDLRPDLDQKAREAFRSKLVAAGARVEGLSRGGSNGAAREAADQLAAELGGALAGPRREDPLANEDDPRVLASAIVARSNNRG
jgi:hypothetical protein